MRAPRVHRAFTLVELLIAMTLTALIVTLLAKALNGALSVWKQAEERTDTIREARAALDLIAGDLSHVMPVPGAPSLVLDYNPKTASPDRVNQEIYMLTATPNTGRSDICAVGYYCTWDPNLKAFRLIRHFKNSDETTQVIRTAFASGSISFLDLYTRASGREEQVAAFIWDLQFGTTYPEPHYSDILPRSIEVRMKAISARQGRLLKTLPITRETWTQGTKGGQAELYRNVILPYQQQLVTRARL